MNYLDRDLLRSFGFAFLVIIVLVQVALLVDVLLSNYRYMFGEGGSRLGWVMLYYLFSLPRQAAYTIPVGAAVSILWVYVSKGRHNELLAWFCGGVSPMRVARPLILLGLMLSAGSFVILEYLASSGERAAYRIERVNIQGRSEESITRDKNIFRKGAGRRYYHIDTFDTANQTMEHPSIREISEDGGHTVWRVDAAAAQFKRKEGASDKSEGMWTFSDVTVRRWNDKGELLSYERHPSLDETQLPAPMEKHFSEFIVERQKPSQMTAAELSSYIQLLEAQNKPTYTERTYFHEKLAIPMAAFVLAILMCGHVMSPSSISIIKGFGGGLAWIVVYWLPFTMLREVAKSGALDPIIAMHGPNIIFMAIGFYLIRKTRFAS